MNSNAYNFSSDEHLVMTTFKERERLILCGLKRYLTNVAGEYFTEEEINRFLKMLQNFRHRPENLSFSKNLCLCVSSSDVLKNRFIPRKRMRKDELVALIYSVAPYALLTGSGRERTVSVLSEESLFEYNRSLALLLAFNNECSVSDVVAYR